MLDINKYKIQHFFNFFLALFPLSFLSGNLIINSNLFLLLIFGILTILKNNLKLKFDSITILLALYFCSTIFSTLLNNEIPGSQIYFKSFFYLRFLFLFIIFKTLSENNLVNLGLLFKVCFYSTTVIALDIFIQFIFGINILGLSPLYNEFYTGVFGNEKIAGGYLQEFFLLSLISLINLREKKYYNVLFIFFTSLILFAIVISGNRIPLVLTLFSLLILFSFIKSLRFNILICFLFFGVTFGYLFKSNESINQSYLNLYQKIFVTSNISSFGDIVFDWSNNLEKSEKDEVIPDKLKKFNFFSETSNSSTHGYIYLLTLRSFSENKLIGNGFKSSRRYCYNEVSIKDKWCLSHPHNYHLEILNDSGSLGYLLVAASILLLFLSSYKNLKSRKNLISLILLIAMFIEVWPLKSTGSLYGTWSGSIAWFILALNSLNIKSIKD